jgi:hypothetical protein
MERFGLSRLDLMLMSWTQLIMMFDAANDDEEQGEEQEEVRMATPQDYANWI